MSERAISVRDLGKQYRIGGRQQRHETFVAALTSAMASPFRRLTNIGDGVPAEQLFWALRNVSFEVNRGEVLGIIGRNGAGKSTLLKVLSRITEPTEGHVEVHGRLGSLLEVGTGFHPDLTGRENIFLNGTILGMKRREVSRKFDEIVDFSGIEQFLDTPVKRYSSGMYVRLAFAVAAHLEPDILLVDEVLTVGDMAFQKKCLGKMRDIAGEDRTVIFVSHNMAAVKSLCQRAIMINQGAIEHDGPAAEVVQHYLVGGAEGSSKVWPADDRPGNHCCKLDAVRLLDSSGEEVSSVYLSEELLVEIAYEITEPGSRVGFSLNLFDGDGQNLFASLSNREPRFYGQPLQPGRYKSVCRLPPDFFNTGRFYLSLTGFAAHWTDPFNVDQIVSFEALDDGRLRGDFYGGYGGSLRPKLDWETRQCLNGR
jgi:lipopolysaccharide transport system ATP-binding protein